MTRRRIILVNLLMYALFIALLLLLASVMPSCSVLHKLKQQHKEKIDSSGTKTVQEKSHEKIDSGHVVIKKKQNDSGIYIDFDTSDFYVDTIGFVLPGGDSAVQKIEDVIARKIAAGQLKPKRLFIYDNRTVDSLAGDQVSRIVSSDKKRDQKSHVEKTVSNKNKNVSRSGSSVWVTVSAIAVVLLFLYFFIYSERFRKKFTSFFTKNSDMKNFILIALVAFACLAIGSCGNSPQKNNVDNTVTFNPSFSKTYELLKKQDPDYIPASVAFIVIPFVLFFGVKIVVYRSRVNSWWAKYGDKVLFVIVGFGVVSIVAYPLGMLAEKRENTEKTLPYDQYIKEKDAGTLDNYFDHLI